MPKIDTSCATVPTSRRRVPATPMIPSAAACTRRPSPAPPRRSTRVSTSGQLARDEYARAVVEARLSGVWL